MGIFILRDNPMKSAHEFGNLITDRQFNGFMLLISEGVTKNKDNSRTAP